MITIHGMIFVNRFLDACSLLNSTNRHKTVSTPQKSQQIETLSTLGSPASISVYTSAESMAIPSNSIMTSKKDEVSE